MTTPSSPKGDQPVADTAVQQSILLQAQAAAAAQIDPARVPIQDDLLSNSDLVSLDATNDDVPPPTYGDIYGEIRDEKNGLGTSARVTDDGRVNIRINQFNRRLSQLFSPALRQQVPTAEETQPLPPPYVPPSLGGEEGIPPPPPLNIVIQVVGSRGDVQPFIALGKVLKDTYGHRVRLATHPVFKDFVQENGLEFFSIGGDPSRLMAFMVKNPSLVPGLRSLMSGDISQRRRDVAEYIQGCWRSCYKAGDGMSLHAAEDDLAKPARNNPGSEHAARPFVADCIIANPPSFAHIHCAEKLGIPLHIMSTMPYSATQAFPHPLANIQSSNADPQLTNYISYAMIEVLSWQGLGDIINRFRAKCLGLDPVSLIWAPGMLHRLKVPHTYCWSPALIPKPNDWGSHISIAGFYSLNSGSMYAPTRDLQTFLDAGPPPIYVGFGSIVLDDPKIMTGLVLEAARRTGQRVLLLKGWGGIGVDDLRICDNVFLLDDVPHDWLFQHVSCVVHHGGAGTTAAGIIAGKPTVIVPFFGDQPFWGAVVARAGAGPEPIPYRQLTADNLTNAINFCLNPERLECARKLASRIAAERGSDVGAQSFHQHLEVDRLRCTLAPSRLATWRIKRTQIRLSAFAACTLANANLLDFHDLKLFRPQEYRTDEGPWDPISGFTAGVFGTISSMVMGVADFPSETKKALQIPVQFGRQQSRNSVRTIASISEISDFRDASGSREQSQISLDIAELPAGPETQTSLSRAELPPGPQSQSSLNIAELPAGPQSRTSLNIAELPTGLPTQSSLFELSASNSNLESSSVSNASQGQSNSKQGDASRRRVRSREKSSFGKDPDMLRQTGVHTSKGLGRIVKTAVQAPMELSMTLTKGFHNLPKLWGDDTVRSQEQVTDLKSGATALGKEFGFGFYDGVTGLFTQPWRGARKEGVGGFFKGVGKGVGGFVAKPGAALFGIPSYMMKGVHKEVQKLFGNNVQSYIIASRTAQGYEEWLQSSDLEKQDVIVRWKLVQKNIKKKHKRDEMVKDTSEAQQELNAQGSEARQIDGQIASSAQSTIADTPISDSKSTILSVGDSQSSEQSRGAAQTDEALEHEKQLNPVMMKSLSEQGRESSNNGQPLDMDLNDGYDDELEWAIRESKKLAEDATTVTGGSLGVQQSSLYDSGHLAGTTQSEFEAQQQEHAGEKTAQERTEEEIVLAYVKKQSLLEVHHRNKGKGRVQATEDKDDGNSQEASGSGQNN